MCGCVCGWLWERKLLVYLLIKLDAEGKTDKIWEAQQWAHREGNEAVSLASVINDSSVYQPPADETKLKMMQEVSENFEVSLMNVMKQIHMPWELSLKRFSEQDIHFTFKLVLVVFLVFVCSRRSG